MKQLVENVDYYFNDQGLMVLTRDYLQARGYCCGNGCMNCPYDYINVPEPLRTHLMNANEQKTKDNSK